jgi:hypothetical protein
MDFREKQNRRESFIQYFALSLHFKDCDPAVWTTNYLNERFEHNIEQRYWLAWLYGNTYQLPTSWVLMNEFPDFELCSVSRITDWSTENYKRLRYQTDTKWNKGHLPVMFESYKAFIGDKLQHERFEALCTGDKFENFNRVWEETINGLHKFGRYSTWFYLQHLKQTCGLNIEPSDLKLNDYSGSRSHRNGLLLALGRDDEYDAKLTKVQYADLESEAKSILDEFNFRFPDLKADNFYFETCLCAYKKLFRKRDGRYIGYYLDRQCEEIQKAMGDGWTGIQWNVLWQARDEELQSRVSNRSGVDKPKMEIFMDSGMILHGDELFDCLPVQSRVSLFDF